MKCKAPEQNPYTLHFTNSHEKQTAPEKEAVCMMKV